MTSSIPYSANSSSKTDNHERQAMVVQKFRSFQEAKEALWCFKPDADYYKSIQEFWNTTARLRPLKKYPHGISKYKFLAEAEKEMEKWLTTPHDEKNMNQLIQTEPVNSIQLQAGDDTILWWAENYIRFGVTSSASSQKVLIRDLNLFLNFIQKKNILKRSTWSPRLTVAFMEFLKSRTRSNGHRWWNDRTINRIIAHLKTFAKWVHGLQPFPLGNPTEKIKGLATASLLTIERALTKTERRRLLDAADLLLQIGGISKDRRRSRQSNERQKRKGYRAYRNRAILYCLIETGMRRAAIVNVNLADIDFLNRQILVTEKGNVQHSYLISKEGTKALEDYLRAERKKDNEKWNSPAFFLSASTSAKSNGRLTTRTVNNIWKDVCQLAGVKNKTPHSARHAMGKHIMEKTGNIAAVQRQLGHQNATYSMQYARISNDELSDVLNER
jgi:integrase